MLQGSSQRVELCGVHSAHELHSLCRSSVDVGPFGQALGSVGALTECGENMHAYMIYAIYPNTSTSTRQQHMRDTVTGALGAGCVM